MKHLTRAIILSAAVAAGPAAAGDGGSNRGVLGGAIGATVGGLIGSQLADGDARIATTAAGAVGGFLVGKEVAHAGHRKHGKGYRDRGRRKSYGHNPPRIRPIRDVYLARTASNVRAGPGKHFEIIGRLHRHERVRVIGKVRHRNWYRVRDRGRPGYVYAPLLRAKHQRGDRAHGRSGDHYAPGIRPIREVYLARTASNVRAGPGKRFEIVGRLHRHERVRVIGKVRHRNWYLVRDRGRRGYVYAPLLRPGHERAHRGYHNDDHYRRGRDRHQRPEGRHGRWYR